MVGRFREICAGVNCDPGTAAAFRDQWKRESIIGAKFALPSPGAIPQGRQGVPQKHLLLSTTQAPGDALAMTAAIYSLHRAHPGKFLTSVSSPYPDIFEYNPDVVPTTPDATLLSMHYPSINQCNQRAIHFMQGYCEFLSAALGIHVPLLTNRPQLFFKGGKEPPVEDFWLVCSGGKNDFTAKLWGYHNYQQVIYSLKGSVRFVQVGNKDDNHLRLMGAEDMVGKTNLRELFDLTRRARGVVCGVSLLMHIAAALEKPAIVIAGGREPVAWNAYPKQQYLHTVGATPCTDLQGNNGGACWRSRVVKIGDNSPMDRQLCQRPVAGLPECMRMINPTRVAELVSIYNRQYNEQRLS